MMIDGASIDPYAPTTSEEADLMQQYPINRPISANRRFERREDGIVVEVVDEVAARAIRAFLDGNSSEV